MSAILWISLIVAGWGLLPAIAATRKRPHFAAIAAWSIIGVFVAAPGLRSAIVSTYPQDSLFTLKPLEQAGVVMIAGSPMLIGGWLAFRLACHLSVLWRSPFARVLALTANLNVTLAGYAALYILSPQLFYTYYQMIIPGLPVQWVIRGGKGLTELASALQLQGDNSLAMSAAGAFFWALAGLTISVHAISWRARSNPQRQLR